MVKSTLKCYGKSLNPYYTGIHLHFGKGMKSKTTAVLILIILEYIYMVEKKEELYETLVCLNPYYTGIHLHMNSCAGKKQ